MSRKTNASTVRWPDGSADGLAGSFQLAGLTPGSWLVIVRAEGYQEVEQRVELTPETVPELSSCALGRSILFRA